MTGSETKYERLAEHFVEDQRSVLGDRARQLAGGVSGVQVDGDGSVTIEGDGRAAINSLVETFQSMFGGNVERSIRDAASELDQAVDVPATLVVDTELRGFTEHRKGDSWEVANELGEVPSQPGVWAVLFGFGTVESPATEFDVTPIAERRGIPLDASASVHEAWAEQKRKESGLRIATGHTWVGADEIPNGLLSNAAENLVGSLKTARDRYSADHTRLIVWLRYLF